MEIIYKKELQVDKITNSFNEVNQVRILSGEEVVTLRGEIRREIAVNQEIYERDKEGKKEDEGDEEGFDRISTDKESERKHEDNKRDVEVGKWS